MSRPNPVTYTAEPELESPVLIAAFRGWNDAGDAASFAAGHLARAWSATEMATIDPEEFYDFQAVRPHVELVDGITRKIKWPSNVFSAAKLSGSRDVIILIGQEPNLRWRAFGGLIVEVASRYDVSLVITLGALLADVPHSRPVPITGTAVNQKLIQRLALERSQYEGPTGIVGVLHDALGRAGIDSASLWAAVPHYLGVTPNPKAALALIRKTMDLLGATLDVTDLERAADAYESRIGEIVAADEDIQSYVELLEERADERSREEQMDSSRLPTADAIAAEVERYLREQGDPG